MYTLLQMTQKILASLDSDEVTTLDETTESTQVVDIIETTFNDVMSRLNLPRQYGLYQLIPVGLAEPTVMTMPTNASSILWIRYENDPDTDEWRFIDYLNPSDFMDVTNNYRDLGDDLETFTYTSNGEDHVIHINNSRGPIYWTSFDDENIIFDGYDADVDTSLTASSVMAYGELEPVFSRVASWEMPVGRKIESLILNEAKKQAFVELKQMVNPVAEDRARKSWIHSMNNKLRAPSRGNMGLEWARRGITNYGRK
jgi:hypothetical protein